jgi:hypothetical protein
VPSKLARAPQLSRHWSTPLVLTCTLSAFTAKLTTQAVSSILALPRTMVPSSAQVWALAPMVVMSKWPSALTRRAPLPRSKM